jgi:2-keto-3-deoxy-L-rhamnonate aldolase RhmA
VAEIVAAPDVSAVLIGTTDLSLSLGRPGELEHPDVDAAIGAVLTAAARAGVPVIAVAGSPAVAAAWRARGATVIASVATALVRAAFVAAAQATAAA